MSVWKSSVTNSRGKLTTSAEGPEKKLTVPYLTHQLSVPQSSSELLKSYLFDRRARKGKKLAETLL